MKSTPERTATDKRSAATALMAWDVGGAHLKAALVSAEGQLQQIEQIVSPLWMGLHHLQTACQALMDRLPPARLHHVVTMTGEMADFFPDRSTGVLEIISFLESLLITQRCETLQFFAGPAGLLDCPEARAKPLQLASANWAATAQACTATLGEGILLDIGSTTTDIVPFSIHRPVEWGYTDAARLDRGELSYLGIVRTPLLSLADRAPVQGAWRSTVRELYATSSDVFRVLGQLDEGTDLQATADNGPKTVDSSARRLLRQIGEDLSDRTRSVAIDLAAWYRERLLGEITASLHQRLSRGDVGSGTPLVAAGIGASLVAELGRRVQRDVVPIEDLLWQDAPADLKTKVSHCAPAAALARLAMAP